MIKEDHPLVTYLLGKVNQCILELKYNPSTTLRSIVRTVWKKLGLGLLYVNHILSVWPLGNVLGLQIIQFLARNYCNANVSRGHNIGQAFRRHLMSNCLVIIYFEWIRALALFIWLKYCFSSRSLKQSAINISHKKNTGKSVGTEKMR